MGSDDEFDQLEFRDGRLVNGDDEDAPSGSLDAEPVVPDEESGFAVEIKTGALQVNDALIGVYEEYGEVLSFSSRRKAEMFARQLSAESGALRVQSAAPNDPSGVDGYLLAEYDRSVREPASVEGEKWTFDVGANLYGALGEAVVTSGSKPPALEYFVKQDLAGALNDTESELRVRVTSGEPVSLGNNRTNWIPDCCLEARDGWRGELLERYWCEIKTGDASFERSQATAMEALAADERVLKIRVLIDELPDQYSVRIHEVDPPKD